MKGLVNWGLEIVGVERVRGKEAGKYNCCVLEGEVHGGWGFGF